MQPILCEGWLGWKGKNKILEMECILPSLFKINNNTICLLLVEKHIDHLFYKPKTSAFCSLMWNNKLKEFELCPFGPTTSMSEKMCLEWKEKKTMLEIPLPILVFWKSVLETLISCLRFLHIYSCVLVLVGSGRHTNTTTWGMFLSFSNFMFLVFFFQVFFLLCLFALIFCRIFKF